MDAESCTGAGLGLALLAVFGLGFIRFVLADRERARQLDQAERFIDAKYGTGADRARPPFDRT